MTLARPQFVVLDSATLGNVSRDYWAAEKSSRDKARAFLARLQDFGIFVTFTVTHIIELFAHGNEGVVRDRLKFLRTLPLIAWVRPYDDSWFPGGIPDLLRRELHAVVHGAARSWQEIVDTVRPGLWQTGVGSEMFVDNDKFWSTIKSVCDHHHDRQKYIASVGRTDPGHMMDVKLGDAWRLPIRAKEDREAYLHWFAEEMQQELESHGDKRFVGARDAAIAFAKQMHQDIKKIQERGGEPRQQILEFYGIPAESVSAEMTIGEVGELGVYSERLKILSKALRPPADVTMRDVPPETLPSYVLEQRLRSIQRTAQRVSGSDLGDSHMAPLVFYTHGVQVDRRTDEFLNQVRRNEPELVPLMGRFFRCSEYSRIAELFEQ